MNNVERIFEASPDAAAFAKSYLDYVGALLKRLDAASVAALVAEIEAARRDGRQVLLIGNGGSAATASHMANDWGVGTRTGDSRPPFRVLALTDAVATMTAVANDDGYEDVFVAQLRVHYRPGDLLVAISASGNSPNLLKAARWVKARGGRVAGVLGFDGGALKPLCDLCVHVETPKGEYGPVEDAHMVLDHLIFAWLGQRVLREAKPDGGPSSRGRAQPSRRHG